MVESGRVPGAILTGFPITEGLYEKELHKSINNPISQRNIKMIREFLFGKKK
jgi:hypothetical protein